MMFHEEWVLDGGRKRIDANNAIELYNLKDDVGENRNLAKTSPAKRDELLDALIRWQKEMNAPIPQEPNDEYKKE